MNISRKSFLSYAAASVAGFFLPEKKGSGKSLDQMVAAARTRQPISPKCVDCEVVKTDDIISSCKLTIKRVPVPIPGGFGYRYVSIYEGVAGGNVIKTW